MLIPRPQALAESDLNSPLEALVEQSANNNSAGALRTPASLPEVGARHSSLGGQVDLAAPRMRQQEQQQQHGKSDSTASSSNGTDTATRTHQEVNQMLDCQVAVLVPLVDLPSPPSARAAMSYKAALVKVLCLIHETEALVAEMQVRRVAAVHVLAWCVCF